MRELEFQVGVPVEIRRSEADTLERCGVEMANMSSGQKTGWFFCYVQAHREARAAIGQIMARSHAIDVPGRESGH